MARVKNTVVRGRSSGGKSPRYPHHRSQNAAAADALGRKKARRIRPGAAALREIRRYQKSTDLLLRKLPFRRLVRNVATSHKADLRFQASAVLAIQEVVEGYVVALMEVAELCAEHAKRVTVGGRDVDLAHDVRRERVVV